MVHKAEAEAGTTSELIITNSSVNIQTLIFVEKNEIVHDLIFFLNVFEIWRLLLSCSDFIFILC